MLMSDIADIKNDVDAHLCGKVIFLNRQGPSIPPWIGLVRSCVGEWGGGAEIANFSLVL
jgi:hypothetical protein